MIHTQMKIVPVIKDGAIIDKILTLQYKLEPPPLLQFDLRQIPLNGIPSEKEDR